MEKLNVEVIQQGSLTNIIVEANIRDQIVAAQKENKGVAHIKERVRNGKAECFTIDDEGVLWFKDRLVVSKVPELRQSILEEAHATRLSIHPGSNKMYHDLKQKFWWTKMKIEIARYIAKCVLVRK